MICIHMYQHLRIYMYIYIYTVINKIFLFFLASSFFGVENTVTWDHRFLFLSFFPSLVLIPGSQLNQYLRDHAATVFFSSRHCGSFFGVETPTTSFFKLTGLTKHSWTVAAAQLLMVVDLSVGKNNHNHCRLACILGLSSPLE